jgi:tetratricopeptide (TPR) repeat protein
MRCSTSGTPSATLGSPTSSLHSGRNLSRSPDASATYLAHLARLRADLGHQHDALSAQQEAVSLLSRLSQRDPGRYLPKLADSLHSLVIRQWSVDRHEQAVATSAEFVAICRQLVAVQDPTGEEMLADALDSRMLSLNGCNRYHEALQAARERLAVERQRLAASAPENLVERQVELANALYWVAELCRRLGKHGETFAPGAEAINLYRMLGEHLDDHGRYCHAQVLMAYSDALHAHQRVSDAVRASADAVATLRTLAAQAPHRYLSDLRFGLLNLADKLAAASSSAQAATVRREAAAINAP